MRPPPYRTRVVLGRQRGGSRGRRARPRYLSQSPAGRSAGCGPGLRAANAALQAQVDALRAGDVADAATLQVTLDASAAEVVRVQAAIDALTPPSTP